MGMGAKIVKHNGIRTTPLPIPHQKQSPLGYQAFFVAHLQSILFEQKALPLSESKRDHSKMKNKSVTKSLEKSKNLLEEKRKMVERKNCIKKTNTFTIIAMNFVQEQLKMMKRELYAISLLHILKDQSIRNNNQKYLSEENSK